MVIIDGKIAVSVCRLGENNVYLKCYNKVVTVVANKIY